MFAGARDLDPHLSLPEACSIRQGLECIERSGLNVVMLVSAGGRLIGIATDGDIRRALLAGVELDSPLLPHANLSPAVCLEAESRAAIIDLMIGRELALLPVVDEDSRLVGIHTLRGMLGKPKRSNSVLILAGGRGTRLGSKTDELPKPMLRVAGRPILERLVDHFVGYGFSDITLSVAYLADRVEEHFGDGSRFGCRLRYLRESPDKPRGTGGPFIDFVREFGISDNPVVVANGDLVTNIRLDALLSEHESRNAHITIVTHVHAQEIPFGVVRQEPDGSVWGIDEKPLIQMPISAGIYVINPELGGLVTAKGNVAMTELIGESLARGYKVHSFHSDAEWLDVGRPSDLARARGSDESD